MQTPASDPIVHGATERSPRLKVGLLLDSLHQPAWVSRTVSDVLSSGVADLIVVVVMAEPRTTAEAQRDRRRRRTHVLFDLYRRFDSWWFRDDRPDPFAETDLEPLLSGIPRIVLAADDDRESGATTSQAIARLDAFALDVGLRFGPLPPLQHGSAFARFGVWSYAGDSRGNPLDDPSAPGYREVLGGDPVTRSALHIDVAGAAESRVFYESFASTAQLSAWKNRRELYWKTSAFVVRKLRELARFGPDVLAETAAAPAPPRAASAPRNIELLTQLPRLAARYVSTQVAMRANFDQWFIAYRFRPDGEDQGIPDTDLAAFSRLIPPKDRMWADPFPIVHDGRYFLFLEELLFARNKGHISVMEFDGNGAPSRPVMVLETANHLSYPFVLTWKGETFMIPESARAGDNPADTGSRSVPVFRSRRFPFEWVEETVMLDGLEVFDPTIVEIEGVWWLFCTQAEPGASTWDELHLFHGATPFGPWTPHRRNPVKSDVRSARPAGRPYRKGGVWYRPAQNCSVRYGYGLSINRIERLTPTEYREREVMTILPDWAPGLIATHTLNAAGRLSVADGRHRRRKWSPEAPSLPLRSNEG
jgi:hypothetical protein